MEMRVPGDEKRVLFKNNNQREKQASTYNIDAPCALSSVVPSFLFLRCCALPLSAQQSTGVSPLPEAK